MIFYFMLVQKINNKIVSTGGRFLILSLRDKVILRLEKLFQILKRLN